MTQLVSLRSFEPSPLLRQAARGPTASELVVLKKDFVDQRTAIKIAFENARGVRIGRNNLPYPKTTNADVKAIIDNWNSAVKRFGRSSNDKSSRNRWTAISSSYLSDIATKPPGDEFSENQRFWQVELFRVAIWLSSLDAVPTKGQIIRESVAESVQELPSTLSETASTVADAVGDVAGGVASGIGAIAAAPVKAFARGLGITPINTAIALAVIGGVGYVAVRSRKKEKAT